MANTNQLQLVFGDATLGIHAPYVDYLFSYERGGLESLRLGGKEWLYRVPTPTFWRATTDNDRGCGFPARSAQWLGADLFSTCQHVSLMVDGRQLKDAPVAPETNRLGDFPPAADVELVFTYQTATVPATTVEVAYHVHNNGDCTVSAHYHGQEGLPELPVFGLRMVMPTVTAGFDYQGLAGETYPDRMAGAQPGTYHVDGLPVTPYLVPQECGMHMVTEQLTIQRWTTQNNADQATRPFELTIEQDQQPFNFSLLPYTAEELENATHQEELPAARRTVLVVAGAVRGVGGIDSWGHDVQPPYHVLGTEDHYVSFTSKANQ